MTGFVPLMWVAWLVVVSLFVVVSLYASHVAKNEGEQLYLYDSSSHIRAEQEAIVAKVKKIAPLQRLTLGLAAIMTLVVAGYYIMGMVNQFR